VSLSGLEQRFLAFKSTRATSGHIWSTPYKHGHHISSEISTN